MNFFTLFIAMVFIALPLNAVALSHQVLVSVAPHKFFVEKIAGDTVTVNLMVPAGASAHTFEPTPKQMLSAGRADIWFCIGENFETRASAALKAYNGDLQLIDLRQNVDMITTDPHSGAHCCHCNSQDLHIWLSLRQGKIQATTIANALSALYPEHAAQYQEALKIFIKELDALDIKITELLKPIKGHVIMVSHPAYAYFCRDYQLRQLSIEFEGKDPAPQQLNAILNQARAENTRKIFIQKQYSSKGAHLFAKELNAEVITLDPYSEDYLQTMLTIAKEFSQEGK